MRKRIVNQDPEHIAPVNQGWLDLQSVAQVELTSEDAANPVEAALVPGAGLGWRAIVMAMVEHSAVVRRTSRAPCPVQSPG